MIYNYWGFGLHIASELKFPELFSYEFSCAADITISFGKVPETLIGQNVYRKKNVEITDDAFLLKMNTARYYAVKGRSIVIEPGIGPEKKIRLFLLSNVMAAILYQRDQIPLHASAVRINNSAVLFCGPSGAGKSTLAASLKQKGYPVFTDDICVLKADDNRGITVTASYPAMKLWEDSFVKLNLKKADEDEIVKPGYDKYARYFHADFFMENLPVLKIFILNNQSTSDSAALVKLKPSEGFKNVQYNTYRYNQMVAMDKRNTHFNVISGLVNKVPVYELSRPSEKDTLTAITRLIELNIQPDQVEGLRNQLTL